MTNQQYLIKRKLNIVEFAETLGNISEACRKMGVSRQHYYDIKAAIQEDGIDALLEKSRTCPRIGNRVSPEIEQRLLDYSLEYPTHGQTRTSNELLKQGVVLSPGGVRSIWLRHDLEVKSKRLKRLEQWAAEENRVLTESQVQALEERKVENESHGEIETHHPGFLLGQDTYYVGYIKGVGKIYQQTSIDTYSNIGFAKLYLERNQTVAAEFLNSKVLPFFDEHGISLLRTLTDRGKEYCGRPETHHYQLFLHLNDIEHSRTKARHPQTNGCTEKLNQTIKNEFYEVAFRKRLYTSLREMQEDLDVFMKYYNEERTNQGKRCRGRTPYETFTQGLNLYHDMVISGDEKLAA
ncbi:MAG: IS481 family transposase [Bdellovibrionales bacterium]|jgi:transposase InsO family protein|nr:IS481 family transposase [Bdellovibrionales bacterium]